MNCMVTKYKHKYIQLVYDQTKLFYKFLLFIGWLNSLSNGNFPGVFSQGALLI